MSSTAQPARLAARPEDFARLKIKPHDIAQWEDGRRTEGGKGTYEWWYFDAHLDDGAKVVIVFYNKPLVDVEKGLAPQVALTLDWADGRHIERIYNGAPSVFSSAQDHCDVRIGPHS